MTKQDIIDDLRIVVAGYQPLYKNGDCYKLIPSKTINYNFDKNEEKIEVNINHPLEEGCYFYLYLRNDYNEMKVIDHEYEEIENFLIIPIYQSCTLKIKRIKFDFY